MADENSAPAAATGETTPFHSIDAAVSHLDQEQERQQKAEAPTPAEADKEAPSEIAEDEAPAQEAAATDDEPAEEAEAPADDAEPEGESEPEEFVHGNARMRLRDGSVVPVAEGKKALEELKEIKSQGLDLTAQRAEVDKAKAENQQLKQYLDKVLPIALQVANETVPPAPEETLWDTDPIEAMQQQRRHDAGRQRLAELQSGQKADTETRQKERQEAFSAYIREQQQQLVKVRPEIKDPAKAKELHKKYMELATAWGFSPEEAGNTYDHRLIHNALRDREDALKYRALQSAKPKVLEKARDAVPVQKPGRRIAPSEKATADRDAVFKKLAPNGTFTSIDDAAAFLDALDRRP